MTLLGCIATSEQVALATQSLDSESLAGRSTVTVMSHARHYFVREQHSQSSRLRLTTTVGQLSLPNGMLVTFPKALSHSGNARLSRSKQR